MTQASVKSTAVSDICSSFPADTCFLYNVFIAVEERYNTLIGYKKKPVRNRQKVTVWCLDFLNTKQDCKTR